MSDSSTPSSSSPPLSPKIYFKDKNGELKGPYTERQVQEWYREKWFDSEFQFYFLTEDKALTDDTPFTTLGELRTRFGSYCPFQRLEMGDTGLEKMKEKVEALEKELTALRKECEQVRALKQRVIKLEKKIQALTVSPTDNANKENKENEAPASAAPEEKSVASEVQKTKSRFADEKWYGELVDLVVESFEMLGGRDYSRAKHIATCDQMKKGSANLKGEEEQGIFADAVVTKMKKKVYYHCAKCDTFFLQPSHAFNHLMQLEHVQDLEWVSPDLQKMGNAVSRLVQRIVLAYGGIPITKSMRPSNDFIQKEIIGKMLGGCGRQSGGFRSKTAFFDSKYPMLNNGVDEKIEKVLRTHIGNSQTFCDICNTVTGTVNEYFDHLRRFDHVMKMKLFHVPTVVANRLANKE